MKTLIFTLLICVLSSSNNFSKVITGSPQYVTIKGCLLDGNGDPIIGVNITVIGSHVGTMSDINGEFVIHNVPIESLVLFTYMGFIPKIIPAKSLTETVYIELEEDDDEGILKD